MRKAVLISIQPKWCELIASGEKTVEIRKSRPKLEAPFRCYIYCTKNGFDIYSDGKNYVTDFSKQLNESTKEGFEISSGFSKWNGKIIGEFVCDEISGGYIEKPWGDFVQRQTCLTYEEINKYGKDKPLICWHISDLVIYEKPRELSEFYKSCIFEKEGECAGRRCAKALFTRSGLFNDCGNILTRPPQSWCYVEERENNG